jgi:acetylornithine deacetylase/succinyl-diaminopimelate desuccinylase-like protein
MIAIPSVTTDGTAELVDYLLETVVPHIPGEPNRLAEADGCNVNLLVTVPGTQGGAPLLLNSHLDTVPAGEPRAWSATAGNPFGPRVDGDRLVGLGSADAKLDWLCKAEAIRRCARDGFRRPILLLGTYGEERGLVGARRFLESAAGRSPSLALVGEPTECRLVTQHKALLVAELHLVATSREIAQELGSRRRRYDGRAAHSATPDRGESAILKALDALADETPVVSIRGGDAANRVPTLCEVELAVSRRGRAANASGNVRPMSPALLTAAREFARQLDTLSRSEVREDPAFSPPRLTANIGRINGEAESLVLTFDVRALPGGSGAAVRAAVEKIIRQLEATFAGVRARMVIERDNAALSPAPADLIDRALGAMEVVGLPRVVTTKSGCTEAGLYASAGIPALVFGAGQSAGNIHAPNEWTSIAQLHQAVDFYVAFIRSYCG